MGLLSHGICVPGLGTEIGTDSLGTLGTGKYRWDSPGTKIMFFRKIPKSRDCPLDSSPKQSQVVPWDTNPWDSWDWDENL